MKQLNILVLGRHVQIMETVLRLINNRPEWKAVGALTNTDAKIKFSSSDFDLVLIGGGVEEKSERELSVEFREKKPSVKIIRHYGGGSGLLFNEIEEAIAQ